MITGLHVNRETAHRVQSAFAAVMKDQRCSHVWSAEVTFTREIQCKRQPARKGRFGDLALAHVYRRVAFQWIDLLAIFRVPAQCNSSYLDVK